MNLELSPVLETAHTLSAQQAHCQRVVAAATELAGRLGWSAREIGTLQRLAQVELRRRQGDSRWIHKLLLDLQIQCDMQEEQADSNAVSDETADITRLLEFSCFFVERWEYIPYELISFPEILDELRGLVREGYFDDRLVRGLAVVPTVELDQIRKVVASLPVFPAVAMKAMQLASNASAGAWQVESLVASDPVLAGELLRAANSPLYSPAIPVRTIRQAVTFLGMGETCRVIAAAAFRPLFRTPLQRPLWVHSLEVARAMDVLARYSGKADPEEAFLVGLLHDVGRLALWKLPAEHLSKYQQLMAQGCEPMFAEVLLCGFDHTVAGAEVARHWRLESDVADAVAYHHQPERLDSKLAHLLYLAEHCNSANEDLPSLARLKAALSGVGMRQEELASLSLGAYQLVW